MVETRKEPERWIAYQEFLKVNPKIGAGEASGQYLRNRIQVAFEEGWAAAVKRMKKSVGED